MSLCVDVLLIGVDVFLGVDVCEDDVVCCVSVVLFVLFIEISSAAIPYDV